MNKPSASEQFNRIVQTSSGILQIFRPQLSTHVRESSSQHLIDLGVAMKRKDMAGIRTALGGVRNDLKEIFDALDADNPNKSTIAQCIQDINTWARENMARISPPQGHPALQHSAVSLPDIPDAPQDDGSTKRHPHVFPLPTRPQPSHGNAMIQAVSPGNGQIQSGGHAVAVSSAPRRATAPAISLPDISPEQLSGKTYYESGRPAVSNAAIDVNMSQYFLALHRDGYKTVSTIGEGGMGFVVKAQNLRVGNREEAIKVITVPGSDRDLDREAEIGGMFELEDGIVRVNSAGEALGNKYIAMPYIANVRDLSNLPKTLELLPRHVMALGILKGLKNMHSKNILHRDMKPANVLATGVENGDIMHLLENLRTYLTDFGIALNLKKHEAVGRAGTPRYMSPEQIRRQKLTLASDVFSAGLTLYEIYTGELPYPKEIRENPDPNVVMQYISKQKGSLIKTNDKKLMKAGVPEEIHELLVAMTQVKPEDRPDADMAFATVDEYLHELRPDVQEAKSTQKRKRQATWAAGVLGVGALVGVALLPGIKKGQRLDAFNKNHSQTIANSESAISGRQWNEAIALLEAEIERVSENEDLEESEKVVLIQRLQGRLQEATEKLTALQNARDLIRQGMLLLNPVLPNGEPDPNTPPNLEGAREKFRQAMRMSEEVQAAGNEGLLEANRRECRMAYTRGIRHYNRGELEEVRREFSNVTRLHLSGLNEVEQQRFQEMQNILEGWDERLLSIRRECVTVYGVDDFEPFKRIIDQWKTAALEGDRDSVTKILEMNVYLNNHPGAPEYEKKFFCLYDAIFEIDSTIMRTLQNPRCLQLLQGFYMDNVAFLKSRIPIDLINQNFDRYCVRFIRLLDNGERLLLSVGTFGQMITPVSGSTVESYIGSTYADLFNNTNLRNEQREPLLSPAQKKILEERIREKHSQSTQIMEWVNVAFSNSEDKKANKK